LMVTINQNLRTARVKKLKYSNTIKLLKNPSKKAICARVLTISPKKPNSANRCVIKATLTQNLSKLIAKVPGEKHSLQQHSTVLIRGARVRDLIGVSYAAIRGKYDLVGVANRKTKRSRFGVKKI